nr:hypothetical protein [uncultured Allomuricauda sp.]
MYKIACLAHAIKGNRVAKFGEIVSEKDLNGNAKVLIEKGFIKEATKSEIEAAKKGKTDDGSQKNGREKKLSKMNTAELEAKAKELGVEFSPEDTTNAKKATAIQAFIDAKDARENLEAKAKELKVDFSEETSNEDLQKAIDAVNN